MNLLIVDDEVLVVRSLMDTIPWDALPFANVFTAHSVGQAKAVFAKETVDVLLSDIEMPNGNGLELVVWVQEQSPVTICLMLTCHAETELVIEALRAKCVDYVLKPARTETLMETLTRAAEMVKERRKHIAYMEVGQRMAGNLPDIDDPEADPGQKAVEMAEQYILDHIAEPILVDTLAAHVYMSATHLTRLFRKKHNMTPIDYVTDRRMRLAAELLRNKSLSAADVAGRVGYSNYPYFSTQFRKMYGISPSEYRSRI